MPKAAQQGVLSVNAMSQSTQVFRGFLQQLFLGKLEGQLVVEKDSVRWTICMQGGKLIYASHSVDPVGRLITHLQRMSHACPKLTPQVRAQARDTMQQRLESHSDVYAYNRVMEWLLTCGYLTPAHVNQLTTWWIHEALSTLIVINEANAQVFPLPEMTTHAALAPETTVSMCTGVLKQWIEFGIAGASPYQRPYFFNHEIAKERLTPEVMKKLAMFLRGDSFTQLAAKLKRNELDVVKILHPYILNGTIVLREPQSPYSDLPRITPQAIARLEALLGKLNNANGEGETNKSTVESKQFSIFCVDDSPAILNQLSRFLDGDCFDVHTISNPLRAMMAIARIKPDAILLDIGMPNVDGYELCRLIRNHSAFQSTPIIMVTGHSGIFDRARARLVGASGYLTKPFTQSELLDLLAKHLKP